MTNVIITAHSFFPGFHRSSEGLASSEGFPFSTRLFSGSRSGDEIVGAALVLPLLTTVSSLEDIVLLDEERELFAVCFSKIEVERLDFDELGLRKLMNNSVGVSWESQKKLG